MIDANISEGFTSAIESKNNIKNSLISLGIIFNENDNFSTYSTKITENLMSKSEVNEGKEKIAVAITNKGVETSSSDSFEVMAENIDKIEQSGGGGGSTGTGLDNYLNGVEQENNEIITETATSILPYFYYILANRSNEIYYNKGPFTISLINLKNVEKVKCYSFYCNKAKYLTVNSIICPKLKETDNYSFSNIIFDNVTQDSFPNLIKIGTSSFDHANFKTSFNTEEVFSKLTECRGLSWAVFPGETINLPNLKTLEGDSFFWGSVIKKWILPNLQFGTTKPTTDWTWMPPNCYSFLNPTLSLNEEIILNKVFLLNWDLWSIYSTASDSQLKKLVIPHVYWYANKNFSDLTYIYNGDNIGMNLPNLYYLHIRSNIPIQNSDRTITESVVLSKFKNLQYLIIGFAQKDDYTLPWSTTQIDWNRKKDIGLPNVSNCGQIKAVILQLGKREADTSNLHYNTNLDIDLNDEVKIANLKTGLLDTEEEKGYLYLADADYNHFMANPADAGSNKEWLQGRTRKWSEYKELLVNQYGLDSMADWYN